MHWHADSAYPCRLHPYDAMKLSGGTGVARLAAATLPLQSTHIVMPYAEVELFFTA